MAQPAPHTALHPVHQCLDKARERRAVSMELALEAHQEALALAEHDTDACLLFDALFWRADTLRHFNRPDEALADVERLEQKALLARNRMYVAKAQLQRGILTADAAELDLAAQYFETARSIFASLNERELLAMAGANLANVQLKRGKPLEAIRVFDDCGRLLALHQNLRPLAGLLANLALVLPDLGLPRQAFDFANKTLSMALRHNYPDLEVRAELAIAGIYLDLGQTEPARKALQRIERLAALQQVPAVNTSFVLLQARYYRNTHAHDRALMLLGDHLLKTYRSGQFADWCALQLACGNVHLDLKQHKAADDAFTQVLRQAEMVPACHLYREAAYKGRSQAADLRGDHALCDRYAQAAQALRTEPGVFVTNMDVDREIRTRAEAFWAFIQQRYPDFRGVHTLR